MLKSYKKLSTETTYTVINECAKTHEDHHIMHGLQGLEKGVKQCLKIQIANLIQELASI